MYFILLKSITLLAYQHNFYQVKIESLLFHSVVPLQYQVKANIGSAQLLVFSLTSTCVFQPMKLGEHLNSVLLSMCDDSTLSRLSVRSALDTCSAHIRNSNCDPSFSYVRRLVRLVLGSLSQVRLVFFFTFCYCFNSVQFMFSYEYKR